MVIGTGVAAAKIAEACTGQHWRVAVADSRPYGGTCMLRGCDPKKLLWGVVEAADRAKRFANEGIDFKDLKISWPKLMQFKHSFLSQSPASVENRFHSLGIETLHGLAHFTGEHELEVGNREIQAKYIAIASGSKPAKLGIQGEEHLLTSDDFLELETLPNQLVFIGGGFISFEFAHTAVRAGSKVTILHLDSRPLAHFEIDLVKKLLKKSSSVGIDIKLNCRVERIEKSGTGFVVHSKIDGRPVTFSADAVVHGAGRVPDIDHLNLDIAKVERQGARLRLTPNLQSVSNSAVFAAGDAAAIGPMLTPVSELDAEVVSENLISGKPTHKPNYHGIPSVAFTIPPLAGVGLTEEQAKNQNLRFHVNQADINTWYSARRLKEDTAAFKVLIEEKTNRILGAHVIGPDAEEAINLFAFAIQLDISSDQLRHLVPAYPSEGANIAYML